MKLEHSQEYLDELEFMGMVGSTSTKEELLDMYHKALIVMSEDNDITVDQAHTGVKLMQAGLDAIMPSNISEELH
jgi:hypothetical protein